MKTYRPLSARRVARLRVVQALYEWQFSDADVDPDSIETMYLTEKTDTIEDSQQTAFDMTYFTRLWRGILKNKDTIDATLSTMIDRPLTELTPIEYAVLCIGAYELLYEPSIPYRVVINEALELTKYYGTVTGYKYVNAVLDALANRARSK